MSLAATTAKVKVKTQTKLSHPRLTMEEEILSLHAFAPATLSRLPEIFAESVVDSSSRILGESTGEAFVRCIGDSKLSDPEKVYSSLDTFLQGGSADMKRAILKAFAAKVHTLYKLTLDIAEQNGRVPSRQGA